MLSVVPAAGVLTLTLLIASKANAKYCDGGHYCSPPKECCSGGCCYMYTPPMYRPQVPAATSLFSIVFWNHWYFWALVLFVLVSCAGGCGLWRRRHIFFRPCCWCCCRENGNSRNSAEDNSSDHDSGTSCYAPPNYSRCSSFHHSPPPYNEVTSKPDLYPLVISFGGDNGKGVPGSCLMVQYFRNYIVRPVGSLSAASTVDSLSSSFMCGPAAGDVPPPYPGALPSSAAPSPPPSSILLPSCCSHTDFGGLSGSEVSSLGLGTPGSPPRATTPTQRLFLPLEPRGLCSGEAEDDEDEERTGEELRELLHKIQALPAVSPQTPAAASSNPAVTHSPVAATEHTELELPSPTRSSRPTRPRAWATKGGYAPLSQGGAFIPPRRPKRASWLSLASPRCPLPPGGGWNGVTSSRSAPSTPSTHLAPPTLAGAREGSSPLLEGDSEEEEEEQVTR